jgi:diguanylate cyclase (GGDEF)-like protein
MTGLLMGLARLPRPLVVAVGLAFVALIAAVDYATGPRVVLNVFYLLPVMLVAWAAASTLCGVIIAAATFLVGPVEAWATGFAYLSPGEAIWNGAMRLAVFTIVLVLMARMRGLVARLATQAMVDELTGLGNLRALRETLGNELERGRRFGHPLSLAYIDLDGLKVVNDRFGHAAGDRLLVTFAAVARSNSRVVDTVARVGGDEFVVLLPETTADAALLMLDRLRGSFAKAAGRSTSPHTCSIGLASFEVMPADVDTALSVADRLMYQVKARGGDDVEASEIDWTDSAGHTAPGAESAGAQALPR